MLTKAAEIQAGDLAFRAVVISADSANLATQSANDGWAIYRLLPGSIFGEQRYKTRTTEVIVMEHQDGLTDQSSAASPRQRSQQQEQVPTRKDTTGEKDQSRITSQQQQADVIPPIEKMAKDREEAIDLACQKWGRFNEIMKGHTAQLQADASHNDRWGAIFRMSIIILSASVTIISAMVGDNQRYIATIVGGVLTTLAGIEAYFQFNRRESEAKRQQREVEALRYKLRHQWVTTVQMEIHMEKRFDAATKFLNEGQEAYNVILNNYTFKGMDGKPIPG